MNTAHWDGDDLSLAVWAAVGGQNLQLDETPETVIDRLRGNGYTWAQACDETGINPDMHRELAAAAAWAGIARIALRRRDDTIRTCVAAGAPLRHVGSAAGISHAGIARIVEREESPRGRW